MCSDEKLQWVEICVNRHVYDHELGSLKASFIGFNQDGPELACVFISL